MSNLLKCCCGCTHNYVVFVPCENTHASREIRMPVTDKANLAGCGLTEGTIYYFDAPNCDSYCGYWKCVIGADDTDNHCGSHSGLPACPACEPWDDLVDPPYELIRPSDWSTAYCDRFTETGDCCDSMCPVDCGFGDIIPDDCDTCYDPADIQWAVSLDWVQTQQAQQELEDAFCTPPVAIRTMDCDISIYSVTPVINGTNLDICIWLKVTFTKNTTANDCTVPADAGWSCYPTCIPSDPGQDVIGTTFSEYRLVNVRIPCMFAPLFAGASGCPSAPAANETMCGGIFQMTNQLFGTAGGGVTFAHAIGWGGNAEIFTYVYNASWVADMDGFCWGPKVNGFQQPGLGTYTIHIEASLPERPEACP